MKNEAGIAVLSKHLISYLLIVCLLAALHVTVPNDVACAVVLDGRYDIKAFFVMSTT